MLARRRRIVPIPARLLCPSCQRGRLRTADASSDQIQEGPYLRRCSVVCTECGYSKSTLEPFVGISKEVDEPSSAPDQPDLF